MVAAVILLVFLMAPTVYAESAFRSRVYIPKIPRRASILNWPSIMNPAVYKAITKKITDSEYSEYSKLFLVLECSIDMHSVIKPISSAELLESHAEYDLKKKFEEVFPALTEWASAESAEKKKFEEVFPALTEWVSAEVIECGFYTIFSNVRNQIYRFINENRNSWIKAVQELAIILLHVTAVILFTTDTHTSDQRLSGYQRTLYSLQTVILGSLDIVTAWLFDYISRKTSPPFWSLNEDPDITCALENYIQYEKIYGPSNTTFEQVVEKLPSKEKLLAMAGAFVTCKVLEGCTYDKPIEIKLGRTFDSKSKIIRIPSPEPCTLTCKNPQKQLLSSLSSVLRRDIRAHVFRDSYMATDVGFQYSCNMFLQTQKFIEGECTPMIVYKYLRDRRYKICDGCTKPCCRLRRDCEIPKFQVPYSRFNITSSITLRPTMTTFPDLERIHHANAYTFR